MDTDKEDEVPSRWRARMTLESQRLMGEANAAQAALRICVHLWFQFFFELPVRRNYRVRLRPEDALNFPD
ncbi:MAG TPA: hypothetical protein VFT34_05920 [Verrucomicrobiae bacterium]|nr:hypothetical protein [Verrucomicrobiae bacterium]